MLVLTPEEETIGEGKHSKRICTPRSIVVKTCMENFLKSKSKRVTTWHCMQTAAFPFFSATSNWLIQLLYMTSKGWLWRVVDTFGQWSLALPRYLYLPIQSCHVDTGVNSSRCHSSRSRQPWPSAILSQINHWYTKPPLPNFWGLVQMKCVRDGMGKTVMRLGGVWRVWC